MNDPNGPVFHQGWHHLFYQTNPFGERCWGEATAAVHWGHARSRDLVHWEHLPVAIWPSHELGEDHCWSGTCVIDNHGVPRIFYTSIGPTHQPKDSAEQWAATGDPDLVAWTKHPRNPLLPGSIAGTPRILDWRDPFVFREADAWYMVTGGHREGGRGCISLFRSADLAAWQFVGIPVEGTEENWECPALFRLGDRWALVYSPHAPVRYMTGTLDLATCRFVPAAAGQFDFGKFIGLYAATVEPLPDGRRILWAWMYSNHAGRSWNGCILLPRDLRLLSGGHIGQEPAREVAALRRALPPDACIRLPGGAWRCRTPGGCAELEIELAAAPHGTLTLALRAADGTPGAEITCDADGVSVAGDRISAAEADGPPSRLRLFVDRSLLEVFVNGRATVCRWMDIAAVETADITPGPGAPHGPPPRLWELSTAPAP